MSLFYIVDGYNLIKRAPLFKHKRLQEARAGFLAFVELKRPHGSQKNRLAIVFDGSAQVFGYRENYSFEVIFTAGETADEKIKEMVASFDRPKDIVVVTDDRELLFSVRALQAKTMGTVEFLNKARREDRTPKKSNGFSDAQDGSNLNIVEREKITEEVSRIWLKKK